MYNVRVLMSTFNGEKFIKEQINSILNQNDVKIDLLIRDDGSTDDTIKILNSYGEKIKYYIGNNLKSAKSFMNLIENSGDADFYAFSDQDDIWKSNKIISAIEKMSKIKFNIPVLYCCDKELVNENKKIINHKKVNYKISLGSSLIKNIATGCTIVINNEMMKRIKEFSPLYIEMHDSWIYRVCLCIGGKVIYDDREFIQYRQHSNNVIGGKESISHKISRRINSFFKCQHVRENTAKELLTGYQEEMSEENIKIVQALANYRKSIKDKFYILFNRKIKTESFIDNFIFRCALILNRV